MLRLLVACSCIAVSLGAASILPYTEQLKKQQAQGEVFLVVPLNNVRVPGIQMFVANVSVGTPPQLMAVSFETISALSYVPSKSCDDPVCVKHRRYDSSASSTYEADGTPFEINGVVNISGILSRDNLGMAGITLTNQTFGEATHMFGDWQQYLPNDGSFGLGLTGWLLDSLKDQGHIKDRMFGLYLGSDPNDGELTLGGINAVHYTGEIQYLDVLGEDYWTIRMDDVAIENLADVELCGHGGCPGSFMTSTPYFTTSMDQAKLIADALGAKPFSSPGAYYFDCTRVCELPSITVTLAGKSVTLSGYDYTLISDFPGGLQLCISGFIGNPALPDKQWTVGTMLLQKIFTVFDQDNRRIGFADSK